MSDPGEPEDVVEKAKQALHAQLAGGRNRADLQGPDVEEDSTSLQDEKDAELETELEGKHGEFVVMVYLSSRWFYIQNMCHSRN